MRFDTGFLRVIGGLVIAAIAGAASSSAAAPLGTSFNYQGQLKKGGMPLDGEVDLQFALWTDEVGGSQIASASLSAVAVKNGLFAVDLDFGDDLLRGDKIRWLEIAVAHPVGDPAFTTLTPRQQIKPAPLALALPGFWPQQNAVSPNIIGGWFGNMVTNGVVGATISGGGLGADPQHPEFNAASDDYCTIGGGKNNQSGNFLPPTDDATVATIGGGESNFAAGYAATIAGGSQNAATAVHATIAGGKGNRASAAFATVSGGEFVRAEGKHAFAGGGWLTLASGVGAVAAGGGSYDDGVGWSGYRNTASGSASTVPGGWGNTASGDFSFAAGHRAEATHTGSFVWADATNAPAFLDAFQSSAPNQFIIRASGGVGIGTNAPQSPLDIYGGNWNLSTTEGDFKIGNSVTRIKIGIALDGGGSGTARIRSQGGSNALWLGSGNEDLLLIRNGRVGIATGAPAGVLGVGSYDSAPGSSPIVDYTKQVVFGGDYNTGTNIGDSVKLLITQYDNDESNIYPIYAEDENRVVDFYLHNQAGARTAYFGGNVGIGTQSFSSKLTVNGMVESLSGGIKFPDGSVQASAAGNAWSLAGNNGTTGGTDFLGTKDNVSLELRANNQRMLLLQPHTNGPNLIGGYFGNSISVGVVGGTIGGGGGKTNSAPQFRSNKIQDNFGTIGGGWNNRTGNGSGTVADASGATVGGGWDNIASGLHTTISGGNRNIASGTGASVPGGVDNTAEGAYSLAAGKNALAIHEGTFVWADNEGATFASSGPAQFLVRADGGVGIGTDDPAGFQLAVNGQAAKPGGGNWSVYSDARLKKNVSRLTGALSRLLRLRGVTFEYIESAHALALPGMQTGMIAQDVEKVFPDWVGEDANGYKYVTVRGMEALVVEALRELRQEKDAELAKLRAEKNAQIASLEARLSALEAMIGQ